MSLTSSKRRTKSDSRKTLKDQNKFPGKTTGSLYLGFSSKSRLDKHQSGMVSCNWFCTSDQCFSTCKTMPHFVSIKSTSCLNRVHSCQVEKMAGNNALHFLCRSWLEYDKLGVFFFRSLLAVLILLLCPVTYVLLWYKSGKKIGLRISSLHPPQIEL